jgi:hypothetical protein
MTLTRRQLYETEYIADLLEELALAQAANDAVAIAGLTDEIAHDRAELRKPDSGVVTPAMIACWKREAGQ